MEPLIKLNKLGPVDLLVEGWRIFASRFKDILIVALLVYIPINVVEAFIPIDALTKQYGNNGLKIYNIIDRSLQGFVGIVAIIAIASIVETTVDGNALGWQSALKKALSLWGQAIGTTIIAAILLSLLTLLFVVPGVIYGIYWFFWVYAVALRNRTAKAALDYSKSVVKGQWWDIFWSLFAFGLLAGIVGLILAWLPGMISTAEPAGFIGASIADVAGAYFTIVYTLFFLNNDYVHRPRQERRDALAATSGERSLS